MHFVWLVFAPQSVTLGCKLPLQMSLSYRQEQTSQEQEAVIRSVQKINHIPIKKCLFTFRALYLLLVHC